jgi:hypothetical protein
LYTASMASTMRSENRTSSSIRIAESSGEQDHHFFAPFSLAASKNSAHSTLGKVRASASMADRIFSPHAHAPESVGTCEHKQCGRGRQRVSSMERLREVGYGEGDGVEREMRHLFEPRHQRVNDNRERQISDGT